MQRRPWRRTAFVLLLAASGARASAVGGDEPLEGDWALAEDDVCGGGEGGSAACSLELRQLRRLREAAAPPPEANAKAQDGDAAEDDEGGLPGGWGEAAEAISELKQQADVMGGAAQMQPNSGWGACYAYGCHNYYRPYLSCQCNDQCWRHRNCCWDFSRTCRHWQPKPKPPPPPPPSTSKIMTLFHNTSPEAGPLILQNGFRPGKEGWCGGGIYFAESPQATATKAIGPDSHQGFIIEATVDVGVVKYMQKTCDRQLTAGQVWKEGFQSVSFDPGDGREWIVYSKDRVLSTKQYVG